MRPGRHLRLVGDGDTAAAPASECEFPISTLEMSSVPAALAVMRLSAAIVESQPANLARGYSPDELAAHYAAIDRLVSAFRVLDHLLAASGQ